MTEQITKITKDEAKITAKLYIASLLTLSDEFNTDNGHTASNHQSTNEVNVKVQEAVNEEVRKILKNIDYDALPTTSFDCLNMAKDIVQNKKKNKA